MAAGFAGAAFAAGNTTEVAAGATRQNQASARRNHRGVLLIALPPKEGADYDIKQIASFAALDRMAEALDLVYGNIAFGRAKIEILKRSGLVILAYDPNYPDKKSSMGTVRVAAFLPHHLKEVGQGRGKNFTVIVSRHGIKWPTRELAAVLVHELVGHGMQHLEDRFDKMRNVDLECESWLYEELAYQKLGFDKLSREMIEFRQELEGVGFVDGYCSDFKRYVGKDAASSVRLWETLNPDVPGLLTIFQSYVADLLKKGVVGATQQAAEQYAAAEMKKIYQEGPAQEKFQIAQLLASGLCIQPDHLKVARLMTRSAEQGHAAAQHALGAMCEKGRGVAKDEKKETARYRKAAEQGCAIAQYNLGVKYAKGVGVERDDALAVKWVREAALRGHVKAQMKIANFYLKGAGVARDLGESLFWFTVIAERQNGRIGAKAKSLRSRVAKRMDAGQVSKIEARVREWRPQTGDVDSAKGK